MDTIVTGLTQALADVITAARASVVQVCVGNRGIGSGVVWQSNRVRSVIVTNAHVVGRDASRRGIAPVVVTADRHRFPARLLSADLHLDLALLEIDAGGIAVARIGDSRRLRVGELVIAIGHPWGEAGVVTVGVISGLGRLPLNGANRALPYIRSDVLLAPGNSGGPLLDATGAVIGINAMIFGGDLSLAIPVHVVTEWIADMGQRYCAL